MNANSQLNQWHDKQVVVTLLVSRDSHVVTIRGSLTGIYEDALLITTSTTIGVQLIMRQAIATVHLADNSEASVGPDIWQ